MSGSFSMPGKEKWKLMREEHADDKPLYHGKNPGATVCFLWREMQDFIIENSKRGKIILYLQKISLKMKGTGVMIAKETTKMKGA